MTVEKLEGNLTTIMTRGGGEVSVIHITEGNQDKVTLEALTYKSGRTNQKQLENIKHALGSAMKSDLTDRQRDILLKYYGGMTQEEIAQELNISQQSTGKSIKQSMEKLKNNKNIKELC